MSQPAAWSDPARADALDLLDLEPIELDLFRSRFVGEGARGTIYGGVVAAQAQRAASLTVPEGARAHSLHCYFLRPGDATAPVVYRVYRDHDGRSFLARRVVAVQHGEVILNLSCSFQQPTEGVEFQAHELPDVEDPEGLPDLDRPVPVVGLTLRLPTQPHPDLRFPMRVWARNDRPLGDDPNLHACTLTYLSDLFSGLATAPEIDRIERFTSLDHAMWFYRPVRADEWLLMDLDPQATSGGRGTYTGRFFDRSGLLVAGLAQESLYRLGRDGA